MSQGESGIIPPAGRDVMVRKVAGINESPATDRMPVTTWLCVILVFMCHIKPVEAGVLENRSQLQVIHTAYSIPGYHHVYGTICLFSGSGFASFG
jgi:hypothetical protein